jgi:hypothetical protein
VALGSRELRRHDRLRADVPAHASHKETIVTRHLIRRRALLLTLPAVTAVTTTGCFGSFSLTRSMHGWIGSWKSKWVSWLGFLGFLIIGAYGVTTLVDGLVLNAIEFFKGKPVLDNQYTQGKINTITAGTSRHEAGGEALVLHGDPEDKTLRVRHEGADGRTTEVEIHDLDGEGFALTTPGGGNLLACTEADRTLLILRDATGYELASFDRKKVDEIARIVDEGGSVSMAMHAYLATSRAGSRIAAAHDRLLRV